MLTALGTFFSFLSKGPLNRIFDTIDKKVEAETDRNKIKADVIMETVRNRGDYMRAGGFVLMLLFAVPFAYWFGAVVIYSVHWCANCSNPQEWTIAALPPPLDEWGGMIVTSIFGVIGVDRLGRAWQKRG